MARSKSTSTDGSASKDKVTASTTSKVSSRNKSLKPKMIDTGFLKRFVPLEWAKANNISNIDEYKGLLPLLVISKVFSLAIFMAYC